jgi:UDP-N-acetylglucosamine--N-acetylmuramyl-(pentapeptide) pyrophosphoryl-undecaprenol N-acetylglucosamine transferase
MSGGGTAGHIHPALTVAEQFAGEHDELTFVGTPDGLEARLVPEAGVAFRELDARGFDRAKPWTLLTSGLRIILSAVRAFNWMGQQRPDVVIGFGGYVSIPVGLAAVMRGVPLVLHEQNSVPGLANRLLSRWARAVAVTYPESAGRLAKPERAFISGNPVRPAVLEADRSYGRRLLGVPEGALMLLVFGGSRGARHLNTALVGICDALMEIPELYVVQVTGQAEIEMVRGALESAGRAQEGRWKLVDYIDDMGSAIAAADLVVARAGATSIAELTVLGAPAVLVPYPYATDDHQTRNAALMVEHGAAVLIRDSELDTERFGDELLALLSDAGRRANMAAASRRLGRPDAAVRVAEMARDAAGRGIRPSSDAEDARV